MQITWYNRRMKKKITVDMTLSWTFDDKDWAEEKKHLQELRDNPAIILGEDVIHTLFCLNEMIEPEVKEIKAYAAN